MMANIESIDQGNMRLNDGSEWQPLPGLGFPLSWKIGDEVKSEKRGERFSLWRLINKTRNQETGGVPVSVPSNIKKTLSPKEEYTNLDNEIRIKKAEGELIWLEDDSKWQMYLPALGDPGSWNIGDIVIVSRRVSKSTSKMYQMKNIQTNKELMAIFMGRER
jgi:hypothetical protein